MTVLEKLKQERLFFDGGTGTLLQSRGLPAGQRPEAWNLLFPEEIISLHRAYSDAGCHILKTNTFGSNCWKSASFQEEIRSAFHCARQAVENRSDRYIAFDMGPIGRLLEPLGDLSFDAAVDIFAENVRLAAACGADLILIETMNDSYETKAAVLAAKENCSLPVFVTNVYDADGHLMTGADPLAMIALLEGLGVDALGMNCSFGPDKMLSLLPVFAEYSSVPIIVNPNAGLPRMENGKTIYDISPEVFSDWMMQIAQTGGTILGGCCGTTPEYLRQTIEKTAGLPYYLPNPKRITLVSSYTHAVQIGKTPVLIGERINPTGKPKIKEALRSGNLDYILSEGLRQVEAGVQILDVNVGLPEINEAEQMDLLVRKLQAVSDVILQIDTADPGTLETAMRHYNGIPLVNSVNGKQESMDKIFPLVKKYGGAVIALTLDEFGIPSTPEGRCEIAQRIVREAETYGIGKHRIIADPLTLTVSSDAESAGVTLAALDRICQTLGIFTSLGISNISFGLPGRDRINAAFFAMALEHGLNCAIMNPFSSGMMDVYYAYRALRGWDVSCEHYIAYVTQQAQSTASEVLPENLYAAVLRGMTARAVQEAERLAVTGSVLEVIDQQIIPALNEIGNLFEEKKVFLPQLLRSAEAAGAAFEVLQKAMPTAEDTGRAMVLATVKGDVHDIGKNIVRVLLESYGFKVFDLGRDVPPEKVCQAALDVGCRLVGLSALMTTTVPAMEQTICMLREQIPGVRVVVGGAVLTEEYARAINADFYAKDAMETVRYAERFYGAPHGTVDFSEKL